MDAAIIIITGALVAMSCGLLGAFLVLRKMVMVGDAISHAVLPGIVIAFLISGERGNAIILFGAAFFGMLCTVMIELFHRRARLQEDASIGISFTMLFAIGVILISQFSGQVDLDQDCVLYGEIAYAPLDVWMASGTNMGPRALWINGSMFFGVVLALVIGYKGFFISSFHPDFAESAGIKTAFWHYFLMALVSLVTVFSFESVGAILVVAFLVAPPATAYLVSQRLKPMLLLTCLIGCVTAAGGYALAFAYDANIAGAMASVSGLLFFIVIFVQRFMIFKRKNRYLEH
jgi:manganese/zinc/iron transport system permease protein